MTEDQAVMRCQHGERDAFRYLVERYQDVVFGTAYNMTGNRALAEELAQEAFLSAWKGIRSFRRGRPFKPWLIRILVNAVMAHRRKRSVETTPIEESEWPEDAEHPADLAESKSEQQTLQQAIKGLGTGAPAGGGVALLRRYDSAGGCSGVWSERGHREIAAAPGPSGVAAAIGRRAAVAEVIDER